MSVRLSCIDAARSSGNVTLTEFPATIGRGDELDVCIRDTWASRVHCRLSLRDGQLWVEDLDSVNGTLVNSELVTEHAVASGAQLTVGITTFRVTYSRLRMPASAMGFPTACRSEAELDADRTVGHNGFSS